MDKKKIEMVLQDGEGLTETVEKILHLIRENPRITQEELSENIELTRRGIEWNFSKLKQKSILKRVGPDKGGFWEINSKGGN